MSMTGKPVLDEREWQAQERGMRAAQRDDTSATDPQVANYRVVAQALRSAPHSQPPADFAAAVARLAAARSDAGLERVLSRMLLAVFVVSSVVVTALYGGRWWQSVHQTLGGDALAWLLAGMGCLAVSWLLGQLRPIAGDSGDLEAAR